jgi:hypothetical protein
MRAPEESRAGRRNRSAEESAADRRRALERVTAAWLGSPPRLAARDSAFAACLPDPRGQGRAERFTRK